MSFANMKIGARLGLGFALVLLLLATAIGLGLNSMGNMDSRTSAIVKNHNVKIAAATEMADNFREIMVHVNMVVLQRHEGAVQDRKDKLAVAREGYGKAKKALLDTQLDDKEKELLTKLDQAIALAVPQSNEVLKLRTEGNFDEATDVLVKRSQPATRNCINIINEVVAYERAQAEKAAAAASADYASGRNLMFALGGLAILFGSLVAWMITGSITRPINDAVKVAQTVAAGDLTSRIEVNSKDETGRLQQALKDMNENLIKIVGEVRVGTETIGTASGQIASGNQDLSSRTEQQASSLEETASSMEELTSTVKQNADNARQANGLVQSAAEVAARGGAVVSQVVDTMGSINESSKKIVDIIGVIDGIAFQTNILALNAAVEAARAGEQGRGFAVVAAEVRNLAQRSAGAAKEIKSLIDDSVDKVDAGAKLVDQAGATMREVVDSVQRVTNIMSEISAASQEQTAGIEQINQAITQMDQVTQQNASLVEEAAAAAESMQEQAGKLAQAVGVFKLDGMQTSSARPVLEGMPVAKPRTMALATKVGRKVHPRTLPSSPLEAAPGNATVTAGGEWQQF
jgi:methyl-accepting chemotaxis protein